MKTFPVDKIRATEADISSEIVYNPYSKTPPTLWHSITIGIEPIELGEDADIPEEETNIDSSIFLDGIVIPPKNWDELSGMFVPERRYGDSSFYVSRRHNPIDINSLELVRINGTIYSGSANIFIDFGYEDVGYENVSTSIRFQGSYTGLRFVIPTWNEPDKIRFPEDWQIPGEWTDDALTTFFSRFVDPSRYEEFVRDGNVVTLRPKVA